MFSLPVLSSLKLPSSYELLEARGVALQSCLSHEDQVKLIWRHGVPPTLITKATLKFFSGLTADQFKNWTNIFSLFALHSHFPSNDFECWVTLLASRILTQMQLSVLLLQFCKRMERMLINYHPQHAFALPSERLHQRLWAGI